MASGKTSVSEALQEYFEFFPISSGAFLRGQLAARNELPNCHNLKEFGDSLDRATNSSWLIESVAKPAIHGRPGADNWLLDAVRKPRQVELFKLNFGNAVSHVHIVAAESVLQKRYAERRGPSHLSDAKILSAMGRNSGNKRQRPALNMKHADLDEGRVFFRLACLS